MIPLFLIRSHRRPQHHCYTGDLPFFIEALVAVIAVVGIGAAVVFLFLHFGD